MVDDVGGVVGLGVASFAVEVVFNREDAFYGLGFGQEGHGVFLGGDCAFEGGVVLRMDAVFAYFVYLVESVVDVTCADE